MSLTYLSGDEAEIGKRRRTGGGGGGGGRKQKRKEKKEERKQKRKGRKEGRKGKKGERKATRRKKIAKVALASVRAAFLTLVTLNLLKTSNKLVRIWKKPGGKEELKRWWEKMGGDFGKLQAAISKGSKQQISADEIGVATEIVIANATAALIALVPLIKRFKAEGDESEAKDFDKGIEAGKEELATNPDIEKSSAEMPEDKEVGVVRPKGPATEGSFFSPLGIIFKLLMFTAFFKPENPALQIIAGIASLYAVLGFILFPFYMNLRSRKYVAAYFEAPAAIFYKIINRLKLLFNGKKESC